MLVVWRRYAEEVGDPDLADRMVGEIVTGFHKLARVPGIGHSRKDLCEEPLLFWTVRSYLIIYRGEKRP